jgi:hypothetical protein
MKRLLIVALLLGGCASYGGASSPLGDVTKLTVTDLQAALVDATAHKDAAAMACYPVLIGIVQNLPAVNPATSPVGLVTAFQAARDVSKAIQSNAGGNAFVQQVNLGCAALFNDVQGDILRLGILFRP